MFYITWLPNSDYPFKAICFPKNPADYRLYVKPVSDDNLAKPWLLLH